MWTSKQLLTWAASQIGTKENPPNSNHIWYWDYYKEHTGKNFQGGAWCAAFCATGLSKGDVWPMKKDEGRFRYCPSIVNWAKEHKVWHGREAKPKPGWLVIFANKSTACHVGFVEKRNGTSSVQTIEGNTSLTSNDNGGAVMRRTREYGTVGSKWYILGFVEIKYAAESSSTTTKPTEIVKPSKTEQQVAKEVVDGLWGNGYQRREKLKNAGYDPDRIQDLVNKILSEQTKKPAATTPSKPTSVTETKHRLKTGTYVITTKSGLKVRESANKSSAQKPYSKLTANAKLHASKDGVLKKGTRMSVTKIAEEGSVRVWGKIPSGWVCLKENGTMYAKKV